MLKGPGSRNLVLRLRDDVRSVQRHGADSTFVKAVREHAAKLPNTGSQQHRLRYQDENWLVSLWRWIVEHRKQETEWASIRRVLQSVLDEIDVRMEQERIAVSVSAESFAEADLAELALAQQEDVASRVALHQRSASAYQASADFCNRTIEALRAKARIARLMASRLMHGQVAR
jgi:hypothetical protein